MDDNGMVRLSEAAIKKYCDFCPENKRETANYSCYLCGKDLCMFHGIHIGGLPFTALLIHHVPEGYRVLGGGVLGGVGKEQFKKILTLSKFVCPECAKEPLSAVALKVSRKFAEEVNQKRVSAGKKPL